MATTETTGRRLGRAVLWILAVIGGFAIVAFFTGLLLLLILRPTDRVPRNVILEIDFEQGLVESTPEDPLAAVMAGDRMTVRDVFEALERAREDDRVAGLFARIGGGALGFAAAEEIRDAVTAFRMSGKPAIAFAETFGEFGPGNEGYYLATAFDEIYLQPSGDIGLVGLMAANPFVTDMLEKLGVEPQLDHRYEYKNAMNTFTERSFTDPHEEALRAVVESIYDNMVSGIAAGRGMSAGSVRAVIDGGPYHGAQAVDVGLVDGLMYRDEIFDLMKERAGDRAEFLFLDRYLQRAGRPFTRGERIAVIYGTGPVARGQSEFSPVFGTESMGAETVTRAFREAVEDDDVKAIIFRVDSPGGSYVASDAIWRETVRAREAGIPVIVTMGNVAGSGGYFVAMSADHIVAHPSTITGSIGVVAGKMITRDLWNKLGITWDAVEVGAHATAYSQLHAFDQEEWAKLQDWLDRIYDDFTAKVALGRDMSREDVHEIAKGRIWSGTDAMTIGLVDELGGFPAAIRLAREAAGIDADASIQLRQFPRQKPLWQALTDRGPDSSYPAAAFAQLLDELRPILRIAHHAGLLRRDGHTLVMPDVEVR